MLESMFSSSFCASSRGKLLYVGIKVSGVHSEILLPTVA